jgi:hypothetical protein
MLDCQIFGLRAGWHHGMNLVIHVANCVLLFFLWRWLTGSIWRAGLLAALFAAHPLAAESVAWVAGRRDVLSALFLLLSLHVYISYARRPESWGRYLLVIGICGLAFATKPHLICLPLLLLLLDFWPLGRWKHASWNLLREKAPIFLMAAAVLALTLSGIHKTMTALGLPGPPLPVRATISIWACAAYIGKLLWPFSLAAIGAYSAPDVWQAAAAVLLCAGVTLIAMVNRRRTPALLLGWGWYLAALAPGFLFAQMEGQFMADHLTYVASIGLFLALAEGVAGWVSKSERLSSMAPAIGMALLLILAAATWFQTATWRDTASVYVRALAVASSNETTLRRLSEVVARDPSAGDIVARQTALVDADPLSGRNHYILGTLLSAQRRKAEALAQFAEAARHDPDSPEYRRTLGFAFLEAGNRERASGEFGAFLRLAPNDRGKEEVLRAVAGLVDPIPIGTAKGK